MCKIRIIVQNSENKIVNDFVSLVSNLDINVIDQPAFCVFVDENQNGFYNLIYKYSNLREETKNLCSSDNSVFMNIGIISGCIYSVSFKLKDFKRTIGEVISLELEKKDISKRFKSNMSNFQKLTIEVIKDVLKNQGLICEPL